MEKETLVWQKRRDAAKKLAVLQQFYVKQQQHPKASTDSPQYIYNEDRRWFCNQDRRVREINSMLRCHLLTELNLKHKH
jgi:hypothetical protein